MREAEPEHRRSLILRLTLLLLMPLVLTALAVRWLVPGASEASAAPFRWLERLGERQPLLLAMGFFLLFSLLARRLIGNLRGAAAARPQPAPLPPIWRVVGVVSVLLIAAAAALSLRAVVGQPYRVASASMLPTLEPFDYLLLDRLSMGLRLPGSRHVPPPAKRPRRGDLVVFQGRAVGETSEELVVKRVIGLPGDKIVSTGGLVWINGWQVPFCDAGKYFYSAGGQLVMGRLIVEFLDDHAILTLHAGQADAFEGGPVPAGELFVMGDNRNASRDSRAWNRGRGAGVPLWAIEGKAWRILGTDRDGHLDPARLLQRPGVQLRLPGMDSAPARDRIARCLQKWPARTRPPELSHS